MELVLQLTVLAFLVEATVQTIGLIMEDGKVNPKNILALVVGIGIALSVGMDIFTVIGIPTSTPIVGQVLAGILISRGGNFIHDLMSKVRGEDYYE